jgi:hypothetical protein
MLLFSGEQTLPQQEILSSVKCSALASQEHIEAGQLSGHVSDLALSLL